MDIIARLRGFTFDNLDDDDVALYELLEDAAREIELLRSRPNTQAMIPSDPPGVPITGTR